MQTNPLISVLIPTYNRAEYLMQAIESVLQQTYEPVEIIVVDHGSTDDTAILLENIPTQIQTHYIPQSGRPSVPQNYALTHAQGEFVALLNDDDLWVPHKLETQMSLLRDKPDTGFVYSDLQWIHIDGSLSPPALYDQQKKNGRIFNTLLKGCNIHPSTILIRHNLLQRVGLFDETRQTGEEYDMWFRLAYVADGGFIDQPLVHVRQHPTQYSRQRATTIFQNTLYVLDKVHDRYPLSPMQQFLLRRTQANMHTHIGLLAQKSGQRQQARTHFLQALKLNPVQRRAWFALGSLLFESR